MVRCIASFSNSTPFNQGHLHPSKRMANEKAKPFVKWAGGKAQLLPQFAAHYPRELAEGKIDAYIEPFIGGGAVFLDVAQRFPIRRAYLYDINEELVLTYQVARRAPEKLISAQRRLAHDYAVRDDAARRELFYEVRTLYNAQRYHFDYHDIRSDEAALRAARMIFLNKTCYNGLFRMNRRGDFNVPFGRYKRPAILDEENIRRVSDVLQIAEIRSGDFTACREHLDARAFVYFDPPYRPISKTSSFTSYSKYVFDEQEQVRLGRFYADISESTSARLMLSNSDPKNSTPDDHFFENLYQQFHIYRVSAKRMINSDARKRGEISELVITNYDAA